MAPTTWHSLNAAMEIAEVRTSEIPEWSTDQPYGDAPDAVAALEIDCFERPEVVLRQEDRIHRVAPVELETVGLRPHTLEVVESPDAAQMMFPGVDASDHAGDPSAATPASLFAAPTSDRLEIPETLPVIRRLTVWSPLPPSNHGCELRDSPVKWQQSPLLKQSTENEMTPLGSEAEEHLTSATLPDAVESSLPACAGIKDIATHSEVRRREPDVRILGNVFRFEFPTLN